MLAQLIAETTSRGENLRCGDYLGIWEEGDHPYGQPGPCPFCKKAQRYTNLWYNGPGSPPSYAWQCDDCSAQGSTSTGKFKGDHYGAIMDALTLWNAAFADQPLAGEEGGQFAAGVRQERERVVRWLRWHANANAEAREVYSPGKSSPQHSVDLRARADNCRIHAMWIELGKPETDEKPPVVAYTDALAEARAASTRSENSHG